MSSASDRRPNRSVIRAALADSVVGETLRCKAAVAAADRLFRAADGINDFFLKFKA